MRSGIQVWDQAFTLSGKRFVSGLFWQSLAKKRSTRREEARDLAKELNFDLMVLYKGEGVAQAGFANATDGAPKNAISIAAQVAQSVATEGVHYKGQTQTVSNWLCACPVPGDRWLYVAARDAAIMPQGDVMGSRDDILSRLRNDYDSDEWDVVMGDASLAGEGFANFSPATIEDLIPKGSSGAFHIRRESLLRRTEMDPLFKKVAILAAVMLVGASGYIGYMEWKIHVEEAKIQAAEQRAREAEAAARAALLPPPWASQPKPGEMMAACLREFNYLFLGGWSLKNYTCLPSGVAFQWASTEFGGYADVLRFVPDADIDFSRKEAKYQRSVRLPPGGSDALAPMREQLVRVGSILTPVTESMQLGQVTRSAGGAIGVEKGWFSSTFRAGLGNVAPADIAAALSLPGIRLEKITYGDDQWNIEGTIYGK